MLATFSLFQSRSRNIVTSHFNLREAVKVTWAAKGDLLLPVMVLYGLFGGYFDFSRDRSSHSFLGHCAGNDIAPQT